MITPSGIRIETLVRADWNEELGHCTRLMRAWATSLHYTPPCFVDDTHRNIRDNSDNWRGSYVNGDGFSLSDGRGYGKYGYHDGDGGMAEDGVV